MIKTADQGNVAVPQPDQGFSGLSRARIVIDKYAVGAGVVDLRRHRLDGAAARGAARDCGARTAACDERSAPRSDIRADLFRRAGRGAARRTGLQYLAADRRGAHSLR